MLDEGFHKENTLETILVFPPLLLIYIKKGPCIFFLNYAFVTGAEDRGNPDDVLTIASLIFIAT